MKLLQNIQHYDVSAFNWCLRRKYRAHMIELARWVSKTADGHLYVITGLTLLFLEQFSLFAFVSTAFCLERLIYFILKKSCRRNRPPEALPNFESVIKPGDQFSFPSGHTSAAFLTATLVSTLVPGTAVLFLSWAVLVGMSRVVLGVHFPSDTLAGAALGSTLAIASLSVISHL